MYRTEREQRSIDLMEKSKIYKKNLKKNKTKAETKVWGWLRTYKGRNRVKGEYCPKYVFQKPWWAGDAFIIVDFYFARSKTCLEIDGPYHNTPKQRSKDAWKDKYIESRGMKILRLTNDEVFEMNYDKFFDYLCANDVKL